MKIKHVMISALIVPALLTAAAQAEVRFNGFASIKAGTFLDLDAEKTPDLLMPDFYQDEDVDFKTGTLFGLQASADLSEGLTATVQLYAEGQEDFELEARWAYLAYQINEHFSLKAGRMVNPLFYKSEFEKVGYAHNYASLPRSVYWPLPFSTVEGISLDGIHNIGDWSLSSKFLFGNWDGDVNLQGVGDIGISLNDIMTINLELNREWFTAFGGYLTTDVDGSAIDQTVVLPTIAALAGVEPDVVLAEPTLNELYNNLLFSGDALYYYYGFDIDYKDWLFTYEKAYSEVKDGLDNPNDDVWYASFGKRFGSHTFLYTSFNYEQDTQLERFTDERFGPFAAIGRGIKSSIGARFFEGSQIDWRYDFHPSAALKVGYFMFEDRSGEDAKGLSVGVDLVF